MIYKVKTSPEAKQKIKGYIRYIADERQAPETAVRVFRRILATVKSLSRLPHRCSLAPENKMASEEIRVLIVDSFLLLYTINDDLRVVTVVSARHGRQMPLTDL